MGRRTKSTRCLMNFKSAGLKDFEPKKTKKKKKKKEESKKKEEVVVKEEEKKEPEKPK